MRPSQQRSPPRGDGARAAGGFARTGGRDVPVTCRPSVWADRQIADMKGLSAKADRAALSQTFTLVSPSRKDGRSRPATSRATRAPTAPPAARGRPVAADRPRSIAPLPCIRSRPLPRATGVRSSPSRPPLRRCIRCGARDSGRIKIVKRDAAGAAGIAPGCPSSPAGPRPPRRAHPRTASRTFVATFRSAAAGTIAPRRARHRAERDLVGAPQRPVARAFALTRVREAMTRSAEELPTAHVELHDATAARDAVHDARTADRADNAGISPSPYEPSARRVYQPAALP
jgi:hypothetical protein